MTESQIRPRRNKEERARRALEVLVADPRGRAALFAPNAARPGVARPGPTTDFSSEEPESVADRAAPSLDR